MLNKITKLIFVLVWLLFLPRIIFGAGVVINEVAWAGTTENWRLEWIELFNDSTGAVDITGWQIDNGASSNKTLDLDGPAKIEAGKYFLICRGQMSGCDLIATKLSLHNEYDSNGQLMLRDSAGVLIDATPEADDTAWPGGDNTTKQTMELCWGQGGVRYVPDPTLTPEWRTSDQPNGTPASPNQCFDVSPQNIEETTPVLPEPIMPEPEPGSELESGPESEPEPTPEPKLTPEPTESSDVGHQRIDYPGGIYINEILPSPEGADSEEEWIELYNANGFEVDLTGWQIKDTTGTVRTFTCPSGTKIMSYGFLLLKRPETQITLQNSGDGLELFNPSNELVYSVNYPKASQGFSYSRQSENWFWTTSLTPNSTNIITQPDSVRGSTSNIDGVSDEPVEAGPLPLQLANIEGASQDLPKSVNRLIILVIAGVIAVGSAIVALFLKNKTKMSEKA